MKNYFLNIWAYATTGALLGIASLLVWNNMSMPIPGFIVVSILAGLVTATIYTVMEAITNDKKSSDGDVR